MDRPLGLFADQSAVGTHFGAVPTIAREKLFAGIEQPALKYLGRAIWRRWSGCYSRSREQDELQVRIAGLNGYTALSIPVTVAVG